MALYQGSDMSVTLIHRATEGGEVVVLDDIVLGM